MTSRISGCARDVLERRVVLVERNLLRVADLAAPRAEAAVARADRADEEEHAVGIAVRDVRHRRVAVLVERVDRRRPRCRAPATVGTYCFHIGSPTSLICSSAAGVMRIWKLSNAGRSASTSITSRAELRRRACRACRRSRPQDLLPVTHRVDYSALARARERAVQPLGEDHPIVAGRVEVAHARALRRIRARS